MDFLIDQRNSDGRSPVCENLKEDSRRRMNDRFERKEISRQQNFSFLLRCFLLRENNGVENSKFCLTGKSEVQHDRFVFMSSRIHFGILPVKNKSIKPGKLP